MAPDPDLPPAPEFFVARDRARRYTRRLREALTERKLGYQGDRVGMSTLVDTADQKLAQVLEDIEQTAADLDAHRIRDRERGFMEVPLLVASHGVALRIAEARRLDARRRLSKGPDPLLEGGVLALLEHALERLDRYVAAYDAKLPTGPARMVPLARVLELIEGIHQLARAQPTADGPPPAYDHAPPPVRADDVVLDDLLRAVRAVVPDSAGPWQVQLAEGDQPLRLTLGSASAAAIPLELPEAIARAASVLAHTAALNVTCVGAPAGPAAEAGMLSEPAPDEPDRIERVRIEIADEAAGSLGAVMRAAAGPSAALSTDAEKAVRTLLAAPPLPDEGAPPPMRTVALIGLLRALDAELVRALLPRAQTPASRVAASQVPREKTRKAPVRRDLLIVLADTYLDFPEHRVDDVARLAADDKLSAKNVAVLDAAALLAVLGRTWRFAGQTLRRGLELDPLVESDIDELIGALSEIAGIRRRLEAGQMVETAELTRLERASISVLGRLGRLA